MYEIWQWRKAIASILVTLTLVVGTGGLVSCGFGGGEQEADERVDDENQPRQTEEKDNDDDENQQRNSEEKVDND